MVFLTYIQSTGKNVAHTQNIPQIANYCAPQIVSRTLLPSANISLPAPNITEGMQSQRNKTDFILFPPRSSYPSEMLAFESSRNPQSSYHPQLSMDPTMADPFGIGMDEYSQYAQTQGLARPAHSYVDSSALYVESTPYAQQQQMAFPRGPSTPPSMTTPQTSSEQQMPGLSSASGPSIASASSSAIGSPYSAATHGLQDQWIDTQHGIGLPTAVLPDMFSLDYAGNVVESDRLFHQEKFPSASVDPSLIQPPQQPFYPPNTLSYPEDTSYSLASQGFFASSPIGSPLPQTHHVQQQHQSQVTSSPFMPQNGFQQRSGSAHERRSSVSSSHSRPSQQSPVASTAETDEEGREKGRCPHPDCGRVFRDLKAHMLTHQSERPEKCPIVTCEYHVKGFARKYDKNRHTLTHYKGTMVCGFCPGSGSAAEKSFNRADVFKRHLTSVHGVEQTPPNCRKRTPTASKKVSGYCDDATGKCSTCSATFSNAQDFYEHLDECVLRVVQQEEPSEAINQQRLAEVAADEEVKKTMEKHMLVDTAGTVQHSDADNDEDDEDDFNDTYNGRSGKGSLKSTKAGAGTHSRPVLGNSAITKQSQNAASKVRPTASKKRNNRRNYPPSWGCPSSDMKTKKRVLCVFDGQNRLWKDEMMLDNEFEVRLRLPGGAGDGTNRDAYVTDLDVETLKRAEGFLNATEEERGPLLGPPSTCLMGAPAMVLPDLSHGHMDEVDIDELIY
ncbi:C2H2 finger domain protein, putative [Paecilomyces variotii No. 5]|uniref:C2H2 finger domain protein, putative n=1 Tax=Byssochlamys spectabilis (strain No. 5 / NBRC 109023) TaxID=1356009 RepID=V5FWP0_BYSSN|nr:C2H2 finger domain protein, putative [Paecilomyces variotii No. 5]